METLLSLIAFPVLALEWLALAVVIFRDPGSPDRPWRWFRSLPLVVQLLAWLLTLPVVLALWTWQTHWHFGVRGLFVLALALWSLGVLAPWNK